MARPKNMCRCGKRLLPNKQAALKVLGRTQTTRKRKHQKLGAPTLRGLVIENRVYDDCPYADGQYHLTSESRRSRVGV